MEFIRGTSEYFETKRYSLNRFERWRNNLSKPSWLPEKSDDSLLDGVYEARALLYEKGRVAYGCLVQANDLLFKKSLLSLPAAFVYSEDLFFQENPQKLKRIASELYEYKLSDTAPNHLKQVVDIIKGEHESAYNFLLPENFTYGKAVYYTSVLVDARHLPKRKITRADMPLLVLPEQTYHSVIVPKYYWKNESAD